jgi:NADH dehydrogenase FAD-containing subunit
MVQGTLTNITANNSVEYTGPDGQTGTIEYDAICLCTGSVQPYPHKDFESKTREERKAKLQEEVKKARNAKAILVVGGGIVGVEVAGELADRKKESGQRIAILNRPATLIPECPPAAQQIARAHLEKFGVEVLTKTSYSEEWARENGFDHVIKCTGFKVETAFM